METYKPNPEMCDRFQALGLGLAESLVLTTSIEVEGVWDLDWVWEMAKRIPERKRLDILEVAIAYRKKCLDSRDNDTPG